MYIKNINTIRAFLFDMDGTLVDTEPVGPQTILVFLQKYGITPSKEEIDLFDKVWRRDGTDISAESFISTIFKKYLGTSDTTQYISEFFSDYEINILSADPLPGSNTLLPTLQKKYKLALVTASTIVQVNAILKRNGWENTFSTIISHDDFTKNKPDPESFLLAAHRLELQPDQCIVVEDSKNGSLAGKKAGMFVIGIRAGNKNPQDLSSCDAIFETLEDFQKIL